METYDIITTEKVSNVCDCGMSHYVIQVENIYVVSENPTCNVQAVLCNLI